MKKIQDNQGQHLKYFSKNLGQSRIVLKIQDIPGLSRTVGTMSVSVAVVFISPF